MRLVKRWIRLVKILIRAEWWDWWIHQRDDEEIDETGKEIDWWDWWGDGWDRWRRAVFVQVLEPRFNAELFALLLSIPPNKTLLRRHLSTHFVGIIGIETQTRKRDFESSPGYQPILVNAKVKVSGRNLRLMLKKAPVNMMPGSKN